jgi:hypothetical protein
MLHHCLQTRQHYDENKAFPNRHDQPVTSGKPLASQAHQETEAQHTPATTTTNGKRSVTSIAPPSNKAGLKTEAQPA